MGETLRAAIERLAEEWENPEYGFDLEYASDLRALLAKHPAAPTEGLAGRWDALADVLADAVLTESRNGYYRIDKAILMVALTRALPDALAERPAASAEVAVEEREVEVLGDWLAKYLGNYTLPANYAAPLYDQTHREVAKYVGPVIAEDLLESDWLRDHDAALTAKAKAEAWDEGWDAAVIAGEDCDVAGGDFSCGECAICTTPNPYREPR